MIRPLHAILALPLFYAPLFCVAPARADNGRTMPQRNVLRGIAMDGSTVCLRTAGSAGCAAYQAALLRTVGQKAAASRHAVTVNDLGRRQLDALIASIN